MLPASVGNISATSVGRVKDTRNNGKKEKMVVVGTVEDLSGKAKVDAAELSGARAGENTPRVFVEKI